MDAAEVTAVLDRIIEKLAPTTSRIALAHGTVAAWAEHPLRSHPKDFNQLTALTTGGTTHHYTYAGTDSSDRLAADTTTTDEGPLGNSTTTSGGAQTGFIRDTASTLIGMTSGGKVYDYLTDTQGAPSPRRQRRHQGDSWTYGPAATPAAPPSPSPSATPSPTSTTHTGLYKMGARYYDPQTARPATPTARTALRNNDPPSMQDG
ncbi:hypothetical protein [Streptomyces tropicalis]|uniref:Uncharacterized protein n=1 Tax=Streptomyces tropicalis TaxID=3034234 RepID=A0ABT6A6Q6_9ACTN|nr:hypothetical protein [Streptomyces tropicalis]MDF3300127.1 hypothetical protein [Streptomyces tropicalis]